MKRHDNELRERTHVRKSEPTWVRIGDVIDRIFKDGVSRERLTEKDARQNT